MRVRKSKIVRQDENNTLVHSVQRLKILAAVLSKVFHGAEQCYWLTWMPWQHEHVRGLKEKCVTVGGSVFNTHTWFWTNGLHGKVEQQEKIALTNRNNKLKATIELSRHEHNTSFHDSRFKLLRIVINSTYNLENTLFTFAGSLTDDIIDSCYIKLSFKSIHQFLRWTHWALQHSPISYSVTTAQDTSGVHILRSHVSTPNSNQVIFAYF